MVQLVRCQRLLEVAVEVENLKTSVAASAELAEELAEVLSSGKIISQVEPM